MIPQPLYKLLPLLYVIPGVIVMMQIESTLAALSGILLVSAGVLVFMWRSSARNERERRERNRERHSMRRSMHGLH